MRRAKCALAPSRRIPFLLETVHRQNKMVGPMVLPIRVMIFRTDPVALHRFADVRDGSFIRLRDARSNSNAALKTQGESAEF